MSTSSQVRPPGRTAALTPVRCINGEIDTTSKVIRQELLEILYRKHADIHKQYMDLTHLLLLVNERLKCGASVERGRYRFDRESLTVTEVKGRSWSTR